MLHGGSASRARADMAGPDWQSSVGEECGQRLICLLRGEVLAVEEHGHLATSLPTGRGVRDGAPAPSGQKLGILGTVTGSREHYSAMTLVQRATRGSVRHQTSPCRTCGHK